MIILIIININNNNHNLLLNINNKMANSDLLSSNKLDYIVEYQTVNYVPLLGEYYIIYLYVYILYMPPLHD